MSHEPINPEGASEATLDLVIKTERTGDRVLRDRRCGICAPAMRGEDMHVPYHDASDRCESGKHTHCTCDTCF